jgi:hypothetical protein
VVACIGVLVNVIGVGVNAYDCWSRRRRAASSAVTAPPAGGASGQSTDHPESTLLIAATSDLPDHGSMKRPCSTVCWQSRASAASAVVKTDVISDATGVELALEEGDAGLYYGERQPRYHNHVIEIDPSYRNMIP